MVAYNLIDFKQIKHVLTSSKNDTTILLVIFLSTLFLELEFAIYIGVLLSLVLFLARTSILEIVTLAPDIEARGNKKTLVDVTTKSLNQCPQLKIIRVEMSVYFGSLNFIQSHLANNVEQQRIHHILIIGTGINFTDLSGSKMLATEAYRLEKLGGGLCFADLKPSVYDFPGKSHFVSNLGNTHFFDHKRDALRFIYSKTG